MRGFRAYHLSSKRTTAKTSDGLALNAVLNATLTTTAEAGGPNYTVVVNAGVGNSVDLAAAFNADTRRITVTLGTDSNGAADDTKNTGTLVAAALDGLSVVSCTTSGSGAGIVAPITVKTSSGGMGAFTVRDLARAANVSERMIKSLENGGNCEVQEGKRLADALQETLSTLGSGL